MIHLPPMHNPWQHKRKLTMNESRCDILILSELGLYPFDQGFKVHGPQMARALSHRGYSVCMATIEPLHDDAPTWLKQMHVDWPDARPIDEAHLLNGWAGPLQRLRLKLAGHQGVDCELFSGALRLIQQQRPRVVIGLGQHSPMMLKSIGRRFPQVQTIWYAADELVSFQLSCLMREGWKQVGRRLYDAGIYALLENLFARGLDGPIGVSPLDTKLLKWIAGPKRGVMIRNGVDLNTFRPQVDRPRVEQSLVFWGRMDFEPNVDAAMWFAQHVWPKLRSEFPQATFRIVGKCPTDAVRRLNNPPGTGITVTGEVEDIRVEAQQASAVVLPMRCGGGIKNKLLEAAAMGLPIIASPRAVRGLSSLNSSFEVQSKNGGQGSLKRPCRGERRGGGRCWFVAQPMRGSSRSNGCGRIRRCVMIWDVRLGNGSNVNTTGNRPLSN